MTLGYWKRATAVAGIGLFCLGAPGSPRAEGGEGASLVTMPPQQDSADAEPTVTAPEPGQEPARAKADGAAPAGARAGDAAAPARSVNVQALIRRYSIQKEVPYGLADAIIRIESRYNASARNGPHMGLTQIHTATARSLGYAGEAAGLLDAETNLRYGMKYLATAYRLAGGDTCGTILRYQAGARAKTMTEAARRYCARVKIITAGTE